MLYVFEDNEAVIKMILKGRSPTMRHVSRTHRVALVWLFDRINLDPKVQIRYIDAKHQLADMLTEGNFTRHVMSGKNSSFVQHQPCEKMSSYFIAGSSSAASSPIASESPGVPIASVRPDSRRSVDVSSATQGCIPWRISGRAAEKPVASRRRFRRIRQSWDWGLVL